MKYIALALVASLLLAGCVNQPPTSTNATGNNLTGGMDVAPISTAGKLAKSGDNVGVWYLGTLDDGKVFDTNIKTEAAKAGLEKPEEAFVPLEFTVSAGQMIPGFDKAIVGMAINQTKTVKIPAAEAYGEPRDDLLIEVTLAQLNENGINATVGEKLYNSAGMVGTITKVGEVNATIDFNHELAGKDLNFKITLASIK